MADATIAPHGAASRGPADEDRAVLDLANTLLALLISAGITAAPVATHFVHPALGILVAILLTSACAWRMPQVAVVATVFSLLFQNLFVALGSDLVVSDDDFDIVRGYNFMILSVAWLTALIRWVADWQRRNPSLDPFIKWFLALAAGIGGYFLIGFAFYGMTAIVYLRNIVTPLLLFQLCLLTFARYPIRPGAALTGMAVLVGLCGFVEFFDRETWMRLTNGYSYWERSMGPNWATMAYDRMAKETGDVPSGLLDTFSIEFFNSPLLADLDIRIMRLFGPNMHAISFAYALSFFAIFSLYRGRWLVSAAMSVLLFLASAKGPMILFLLVAFSWANFKLFGLRLALACHAILLVAYAAAGIAIGRSLGDYHVLGLMGGLAEFVAGPLGRGIGAGGNLSSEFASIDWPTAQEVGRTPFAVESAVGVLLSQLGVFTAAIVAFYVWIAWRLLLVARATGNNLHAAAGFALLTIVASGLFQEEAYFAPLALGLFMALAGMVIGAAGRTGLLATSIS